MLKKAQSDAPNYRAATGQQRCGTCAHFMSGRCQLYDFAASADSVCDSWEARAEAGKRGQGHLEYKAAPAFTMGIQDRTVTGIAIVHGNVDDGGDRSHPGLIGDGTVNGRQRAVFLWQHNSSAPPIAAIDRVFEVARADLPPAVLLYAPDTTGGTAITRTYLSDDVTSQPGLILAGLKAGAIKEMSYAFELTRWDMEETDDRTVRNLYQANVFDFSDVNWGMNPATSATGLKGVSLDIEHQTVRATVVAYTERLERLTALRAKEGRVLSGENRKRIADALEALDGAATALKGLLAATDPAKQHSRNRGEIMRLRQASRAMQLRLHELGVVNGTSG